MLDENLKHRIISGTGDMSAVLRFLNGRYTSPLSYRITYWTAAAAFLVLGGYFAQTVNWGGAAEDRVAGTVVTLIMVAVAAVCAFRATTQYSFSELAVTRHNPLPFLRKEISVGHIHEGWLHMDQAVTLELRSRDGSRLSIPLEARMREDFARLYPEVGTDLRLRTTVLPPQVRPLIWLVVTELVAAIVAFAVALTRAGAW